MRFEDPKPTLGKKETLEPGPKIKTVRVAVLYRGKFLMLQKNKNSANPYAIEFPGGKVFDSGPKDREASNDEIMSALKKEVWEETRISLDLLGEKAKIEIVDEYETRHIGTDKKSGGKILEQRTVYLYLVTIPDDVELNVKINQTENAEGKSEDNHRAYYFMDEKMLSKLATTLYKNPKTKEMTYPISRNSRMLGKLFEKINTKQ